MNTKKFSSYALSLLTVASMAFLTSCGSTDDPTPSGGAITITLTGDNISGEESYDGYVGDTLTFNIAASAADGFNTLNVYKDNSSTPDTTFARAAGQTTTTYSAVYPYVLTPADTTGPVTLRFEVVDDNGQKQSESFTINADNPPTKSFQAVLLYAPLSSRGSETFFDAQTGMTYTVSEVNSTANTSPTIDFGYYYGNSNKATIASPSAYPTTVYDLTATGNNWSKLNNTLIRPADISAGEFAEARTNPASISDIFTNASPDQASTSGGAVTNLAAGDYLVFESDVDRGRKRGLIYVQEVKGTTGQGDYIKIDVIVEN